MGMITPIRMVCRLTLWYCCARACFNPICCSVALASCCSACVVEQFEVYIPVQMVYSLNFSLMASLRSTWKLALCLSYLNLRPVMLSCTIYMHLHMRLESFPSKCCEDTRPEQQLQAAHAQHGPLKRSLHVPLKSLGLDSQRVLLSSSMLILCTMRISLFRPDILLSILLTFKPIRRGLPACLPATLLILTDCFLFW